LKLIRKRNLINTLNAIKLLKETLICDGKKLLEKLENYEEGRILS
jgi:hypothetical protein